MLVAVFEGSELGVGGGGASFLGVVFRDGGFDASKEGRLGGSVICKRKPFKLYDDNYVI